MIRTAGRATVVVSLAGLLASGATLAAAASAHTTATTAAHSAAVATAGRLVVRPVAGPSGTRVTVLGSGFRPGRPVVLRFGRQQVATVTADRAGRFRAPFRVPVKAVPGRHPVTGSQSGVRSAAAPFTVRTNWLNQRFGPGGTGNNWHEVLLSPRSVSGLQQKWTSAETVSFGTEVLQNGVLYTTTGPGPAALDAATGKTLWLIRTAADPGPGSPTGVAVTGNVAVYTLPDQVWGLDTASGNLLWVMFPEGGAIDSAPVAVGGTVYVGGGRGKEYALDAATGKVSWSRQLGSQFMTQAAVGDGLVYVGSDQLYALDATTGEIRFSIPIDGGLAGDRSPAVVGGTLYVGSGNANVYAFDAATGAQRWVTSVDGAVDVPVAIDGTILIALTDLEGSLYGLDTATGKVLWQQPLENSGSTPVTANGVIYTGAADDFLHTFAVATGAPLQQLPVDSHVAGILIADGVVYAAASSLFAFTLPTA